MGFRFALVSTDGDVFEGFETNESFVPDGDGAGWGLRAFFGKLRPVTSGARSMLSAREVVERSPRDGPAVEAVAGSGAS